jgi:peptidyl-prolyl cis-trans isomerase SurA
MNYRSVSRCFGAAAVLWLAAGPAAPAWLAARPAPQDPSTLVDRVVAVVGDTAILQSELQEFIFSLQAQGMQLPQDPGEQTAFVEEALDQKVNQTLFYIHARREGVTVSDAEVDDMVEQQHAGIRRQFASEIEFQQALLGQGMTAAEFRMRLTEQARVQLTTQRFLQQRASELQPVPVSEEQVRERFEEMLPGLGPKPAFVSLKQVIIAPRPSEDELLRTLEKAEQALSRVRSGEDFAVVALELSEDPASKANGGDLGWVRRGQLLPEFEEKLFSMRVGEISDPVETSVGYHIIRLDRVRGPERLARHILVRPGLAEEDAETTRLLAEDVVAALLDGTDPDSLIEQYGDLGEQGTLENFPQERLPPGYSEVLEGASDGDVIGPFLLPMQGVPGGGKWVVALIEHVSPAGDWTLEDAREQIRQGLEQDGVIEQIVGDLRALTYIETRLEGFPYIESPRG